MGKELYIDKNIFRAYFGKCFDEILLGDRPYSLKQVTKTETQKVLHTYIQTKIEVNNETKVKESKNKVAGYYTEEKVNVKTGKLTNEQKIQLKTQFLQLAYDCVANDLTSNKIYNDLNYDPFDFQSLPLEAYYYSTKKSGNVVVENDYNKEAKEIWDKIDGKQHDESIKYNKALMKMYYNDGKIIDQDNSDYKSLVPNFKYRQNLSKNLVVTWQTVKDALFKGNDFLTVDDYFNALYDAVLANMEEEDRELIKKELPNFGVTKEEKKLFLQRNKKIKDHFEALDPFKSGNRYVITNYPDSKDCYLEHSSEILKTHFSQTINAKTIEEAQAAYNKELTTFADKLLNKPNSIDPESMDLNRIRFYFGVNKKDLLKTNGIDNFIKLLHDKIMPGIIVSQDNKSEFAVANNDVITSEFLNVLVCSSYIPADLKYTVSQVPRTIAIKSTQTKAIYDTYILPNIKNGSLDMKAMQKVWLDLASKIDEPIKETDSLALKGFKEHKDLYKDLEGFCEEKKEKGAEFKYNETKIEWRNEEAMGILTDVINYYAPKEIQDQIKESFRFGMKASEYRKLMRRSMRGREVAQDALNRIKSLDTKDMPINEYKYCNKDDNGFIIVNEATKDDYLKRCCLEINALKHSYNQRSFWYHIAFWRNKPEKQAITEIENSLAKNGYTKEEINNKLNSIMENTNTDSAFDYKINRYLSDSNEGTVESKEAIDVKEIFNVDDEAAYLDIKEAKKLTKQVLPKSGFKVYDPVLGNVSDMFGTILNGETESFKSPFELEEYAKEKLQKAPKEYTEEDVQVWVSEEEQSNDTIAEEVKEIIEQQEQLVNESEIEVENDAPISDIGELKDKI